MLVRSYRSLLFCCLLSLGLLLATAACQNEAVDGGVAPARTSEAPETHFTRGNQLKTIGRLNEALVEYDQALALNPDFAEAYIARGETYQALGDLDQAVADYSAALALAPNAQAYYLRATVYEAQEDLDSALADLTEATTLDPQLAEAFNLQAMLYMEQGATVEAQAAYEHLTAVSEAYPRAFASLGDIYAAQGENEAALAQYTRALELGYVTPTLYASRGAVLTALGDYTGAVADYEAIIRDRNAEPGAEIYYARGQAYLGLESYSDALSDFREAIKREPENSNYLYGGAYAAYYDRNGEQAREFLNLILAQDATYAPAYHLRGLLREQEREFVGALADYTRAIELDPADLIYRLQRATLLTAGSVPDQNCELALKDLNQVLAGEPEHWLALVTRGRCHEQLDDLDSAQADFDQAVAWHNTGIEALEARASFYLRQGEMQAALEDYSQALTLQPENVSLLLRRASLYELAGEIDLAAADLHQVITLKPSQPAAYIQRGDLYLNLAQAEQARLSGGGLTEAEVADHQALLTTYFTTAATDYAQALELDPTQPRQLDLRYNRALALFSLGENEGALQELNRLLTADPQTVPKAYLLRAQVLIALGRTDEAIVDLNKLDALDAPRPLRDQGRTLLTSLTEPVAALTPTPEPAAGVPAATPIPAPVTPSVTADDAPRFPETLTQNWDAWSFIHTLEQVRDSFRSFLNDWVPVLEDERDRNKGDCGSYLGMFTLWRVEAPAFEDPPAEWVDLYVEYRQLLEDASYVTNGVRQQCPALAGAVDADFVARQTQSPADFFSYAYPRSEQLLAEAYTLAP